MESSLQVPRFPSGGGEMARREYSWKPKSSEKVLLHGAGAVDGGGWEAGCQVNPSQLSQTAATALGTSLGCHCPVLTVS